MMDQESARRFLSLLFDDIADNNRQISIWTLPSRRSTFHESIDSALTAIESVSKSSDVYFGLSTRRPGITSGRGNIDDCNGLTCVWCDLDLADRKTKKKLPRTREELDKIILAIHPFPSMIVDSGGGYHLYWLFTEPWNLDRKEDQIDAGKLCRQWGMTIQRIVKEQFGYDVDSAFDLPRVLRVCGTRNLKNAKPRDVKPVIIGKRNWITDEPHRYEISEIQDNCIDWDTVNQLKKLSGYDPKISAIVLSPDAKVDSDMLGSACANDKRFAQTWEYDRKDLGDQSASSYDLSLAAQAAQAGWPEQEIANLIIQFRRKHDCDVDKALRLNYMTMTIAKAFEFAGIEEAEKFIENSPELPKLEKTEDEKAETRIRLRRALRLELAKWIKHGEENAEYSILLDDGREILIGDATFCRSQTKFGTRVWDAVGLMPPTKKGGVWCKILRELASIEEIVINEETSRVGRMNRWLCSYTENVPVYGIKSDWSGGIGTGAPFVDDGKLHIFVEDFKRHINKLQDERVTPRELTGILRHVGAGSTQRKAKWKPYDDAKAVLINKRYWWIPKTVFDPSHLE